MLPGSGVTDRDDNAKQLAINLFPTLASAIGELGLATLRYDKRGVGASEGDYWRIGFDDRLADAVAAIAWLEAQPEVDPERIFVIGHSEGALLAIRLAAGAAPVAGCILLAGSAKTGEETLLWQGRQIAQSLTGFSKWVVQRLHIDPEKQQRDYIARIKASKQDSMRIQLVQKLNAKWLREFLAYDPAVDLARIHVPVMAITGGKDIQVDPADLQRMAELIPGEVEVHVVPDVTHLFRPIAGKPTLSNYKEQIRNPVDPRVVTYIQAWLGSALDRLGPSSRSTLENSPY